MAHTEISERAEAVTNLLEEQSLEFIIARYEIEVFTLAMHLTGDEDSAHFVTEEVFARLHREMQMPLDEPLDLLIHRYTYDTALPILVGQINDGLDEVDSLGSSLSDVRPRMVC